MLLLIVALLLFLLFVGVGFTVHFLWFLALVCLIVLVVHAVARHS